MPDRRSASSLRLPCHTFFQTLGTKVTSTRLKLNNIMKKDSPIPTLKGWLDTQSDDQLSTILRNRPDTVLPLPPNLASLAARLQLRASAIRAVLKLNALELGVLEAVANLGGDRKSTRLNSSHVSIS